MVAIVESSRDSRATLLYNENKLAENKAVFLGALNYLQEDSDLTIESKLQRLRELTSRNERSQAKTIHFSINFHPDQQLEDQKMRELAREFLQRVDFGDQPALIYRHLDAGHPHAHIVTVNIRPDGSRIANDKRDPHYLQKVSSELERHHNLLPAAMHYALNHWQQEQHLPKRLQYGKTPTKTGIESVLSLVQPNFNYTTLDELNAVLSLYRVHADRGSEYGQIYKGRGLYYRMIDDRGVKIGAPIKASSLHGKPTLDFLEQRYITNLLTRSQHIQRMQARITASLRIGDISSLETWRQGLTRDGVEVVTPRIPIRRKHAPVGEGGTNNSTMTHGFDGHGFYYVDFSRRAVLRDTALGPEYTAESILRRTGLDKKLEDLALNRRFDLKPQHRDFLQHPNTDPRHKVRLLLDLSRQHDQMVAESHNLRQQFSKKIGIR